jgi:hypothetical protein
MAKVMERYSSVQKGYVVAVNDPVGVANDLSILTVPTPYSDFDQDIFRGLVVSRMLESIETAIKAEARQAYHSNLENLKQPVVSTYFRLSKISRNSTHAPGKPDSASISTAERVAWEKVIAPDGRQILNRAELLNFPVRYDLAARSFQTKADILARLHVNWLTSTQLKDWMSGVHDDDNVDSGYAYRESLSQCLANAVSTDACIRKLTHWLSTEDWDGESNLFARALFFNNRRIIDEIRPHIKKNDVPLEGILNLYKRAAELREKNGALEKFDRLILITANVIVRGLSESASTLTKNIISLGLTLTGRSVLRKTSYSAAEVRKWIENEVRKGGGLSAANVKEAKQAVKSSADRLYKEYRASTAAFAFEMDVDQLKKDGLIKPSTIGLVKIPALDYARKWVGSSSAAEFRIGVVTVVLQLIALSFSMGDLADSDDANKMEARVKFGAAVTTVTSSIIETTMIAMNKTPAHPLSIFLSSHWGGLPSKSPSIIRWARRFGLIAGTVVGLFDVYKGISILRSGNGNLGGLLVFSGLLSILLGILVWQGLIAFWWLLGLAIILAIVTPLFNDAAVRQWIGRCYFGNVGPKFPSLEEEIKSFAATIRG